MADVKPQDKADRLKAALKENLKRRKAQARGETPAAQPEPPATAPVTGER